MTIRLTFTLSEEDRKAIAAYYGERGAASRADCVAWIRSVVDNQLDDYREEETINGRASPT